MFCFHNAKNTDKIVIKQMNTPRDAIRQVSDKIPGIEKLSDDDMEDSEIKVSHVFVIHGWYK